MASRCVGQIFSLSNEELESAAEAHSKSAESSKEEDTGDAEQVRVRLEEDLNNACSIACGSAHVAVATDNGAVYTYGSGRLGQLGHGNKKDVEVPHLVEALRQHHITTVACGRDHTVAATDTGEVFFWGNRVDFVGSGSVADAEVLPVRIESLAGVVIRQIACGAYHTAVLAENGDLYVWGENQATKSCAQCNHRDPFLVSKAIEGQIVSIACGPHQTIAVTKDHRVWAWGGGVLKNVTNGHADLHQFHRPTLVEAFDGYKVVQVACGDFNVVGLTVHGEVVIAHDLDYFKKSRKITAGGHGWGGFYSLGDYRDTPLEVDDSKPHRIVATTVKPLFGIRMLQVTVYRNTAMGVTAFGEAYTWTLPDPWQNFANAITPVKVDALNGIVVAQVACGGEQTALLADESTFLATQLRHSLDAPQFADLRIVIDGHQILAHKCILAARCKHWQTLLSLPADQLGGFHLDRDSPDGIDTITFPSGHHHDGLEPASVDAQHGKAHKQEFSYSIVLALLQYLYTDKLIVPRQFEKLTTDEKPKTKAKKTKKHKNVEEDEEAEADETENQADEEEAKKERLAWYRQLERAAKYFKIARLRRLCQRATRNRGFDVQVPSSSLGLDLRWLVEPQLLAFGVREPNCDGDDDDATGQAASFNSDHHTSKAPADETEKQKAVSNLQFAEMETAMKKIEEEYAQSLERAHDRYLGQMQQALELYRSELSIEAVVLHTDHQAWARERARADACASAQRAAEAAELQAKERKAREEEEKRQAQIRREQEEQAKKNEEDRKRAKQEELARRREEKAKEKVGVEEGKERDLERQMVQERGADVKFLLGGECLWAHKLVITSSCEHFRLMFASGMRESELGEVDLGEGVEAGVFVHMLAFLYTDSLAGVDANTAIDLIAIADQFMLPRMKSICEIRIQKDIDPDNVAYVFQGADMYQATRLRSFCLGFMAHHFDEVQHTETFAALPPHLAKEVRDKAKTSQRAAPKKPTAIAPIAPTKPVANKQASIPQPPPPPAAKTSGPAMRAGGGPPPPLSSGGGGPPPPPTTAQTLAAQQQTNAAAHNSPRRGGGKKKDNNCLVS